MALLRALIAGPERLTRHALSKEFCRRIGWFKPDGGLKDMMAKVTMLAMHRDGLIELLPPRWRQGRPRLIVFGPDTEPPLFPAPTTLDEVRPLDLRTVVRGTRESKLWNEFVARCRYLGHKTLVGAQMRYAVHDRNGWPLAMIGFSTAAWKLAPRDSFIGWTPQLREKNLPLAVDNPRFLILPWITIPNLGSHRCGINSRSLERRRDKNLKQYGQLGIVWHCKDSTGIGRKLTPVLASGSRNSPASTSTYSQRSFWISESRQPVSISNRIRAQVIAAVVREPQLARHRVPGETDRVSEASCVDLDARAVRTHPKDGAVVARRATHIARRADREVETAVWPEFQHLPAVMPVGRQPVGDDHGSGRIVQSRLDVVEAEDGADGRHVERPVAERNPTRHPQPRCDLAHALAAAVTVSVGHREHAPFPAGRAGTPRRGATGSPPARRSWDCGPYAGPCRAP